MPSCAAMAPIAQHRGGDAQLACDLDQRPTAARQQGDRLPLELIRKMTPFLAHSTPFRSRRSLAKVSTNSGEAQFYLYGIGGQYRACFAELPHYDRFVSLMPRLFVPLMVLLHGLSGEQTGVYFVDSTKLAVCHNRRIHRHKVFDGLAARGKTSMGWFYG